MIACHDDLQIRHSLHRRDKTPCAQIKPMLFPSRAQNQGTSSPTDAHARADAMKHLAVLSAKHLPSGRARLLWTF
jgi:hypothetical protein